MLVTENLIAKETWVSADVIDFHHPDKIIYINNVLRDGISSHIVIIFIF